MNEKSIYQEALNDMKVLKEAAEQNAKQAILEAITPRLKDLIEKQLFESEEKEHEQNPLLLDDETGDADHECKGGPECSCNDCASCKNESADNTSDDYDVDECSSSVMESLSSFTTKGKFVQFSNSAQKLYDETNKVVSEANSYSVDSIDNLIDTSLSLYEYLQENFEQNKETQVWQTRLDRCYKVLNSVKGIKENKMRRKLVEEKEVTMKIKGLPDDVDLGTLSIDIMSDEGEPAPEDGADQQTDSDPSAPPPPPPPPATESEEHMLELDESFIRNELAKVRNKIEESKRRKKKGSRMTDPKSKHFGGGKVAKLRESSEVSEFIRLGNELADAAEARMNDDEAAESFMDDNVDKFYSMADSLGVDLGDESCADLEGWWDGHNGNSPLQPGSEELCTFEAMLQYPEVGPLSEKMKKYLKKAVAKAGLSSGSGIAESRRFRSKLKLRENSEVAEFMRLGNELADATEARLEGDDAAAAFTDDNLDKFYSMADSLGVDLHDESCAPVGEDDAEFCTFEAMIQYPEVDDIATKMKSYLKKAVAKAGLSGGSSMKQERTVYEDDLTTESRKRIVRKAIAESRKVSGSKVENSYKKVANRLSSELLETNLYNAKLIHTNKLLQLEGLTSVQKEYIIDRLDEAQNFGEVKRVYEGLLKKFVRPQQKKTEKIQESVSRSSSGSSSRPMRSGSMTQKKDTLNESIEAKEWARLAGLL